MEYMVPFVTDNISSRDNWRRREAAVMAFGAVLEVRRRLKSQQRTLNPKFGDILNESRYEQKPTLAGTQYGWSMSFKNLCVG